jgi:hypothetical protein
MGVPTLEVGYTSATTGRGDHEVHKGHVVALEEEEINLIKCRIVLVPLIINMKMNYNISIYRNVLHEFQVCFFSPDF